MPTKFCVTAYLLRMAKDRAMIVTAYGQRKSASSLLAQLTCQISESLGSDQKALRKCVLTGPLSRNINFSVGGCEQFI